MILFSYKPDYVHKLILVEIKVYLQTLDVLCGENNTAKTVEQNFDTS